MRGSVLAPDPIDRLRFPVDPWRLRETSFCALDMGWVETVFSVGNGYLGMRGTVEEGSPVHAHGTFLNGVHETWPIRHAEDAFGFARVGQTIVNAPDVTAIRLFVDDEPLLLGVADLVSYERTLDLAAGMLVRDLVWRTPSGQRVRVRSSRMVSFHDRHLAVMTYEVTPLDQDASIVIGSDICNRQDLAVDAPSSAGDVDFDPRKAEHLSGRVLQPRVASDERGRLTLAYRVASSGMTLAVAASHELETADAFEASTSVSEDIATQTYRVEASAGTRLRMVKLAAYHSSRATACEDLVDRCLHTLRRAGRAGATQLETNQRRWLDDFWARSDVEIVGQPELQQAIRWNLFQIAQAAARAEGTGIPAKGLTGSGYSGHYFWDSEIYVLPFLTYTSPIVARNALRFRYTMLDAARSRAAELNQTGALFPWRTINGEEASAYYAAGTAQYHIDADIAHAVMQYVAATGDDEFLFREAVDILVETARMWADLGFWRGRGKRRFHIHGVTGPDEYTTVVNDNLYTNVMAQANLRGAAAAVRKLAIEHPTDHARMVARLRLRGDEVAEWELAAEHMHLPYDETLGIHPQDAQFLEKELWDLDRTDPDKRPLLLHYHPLVIYRFQVLKQADVVLALYLRGDQFTLEQKRADFDYYDPLTTGDSTLSAVVQAIVASEVGYQELALEYFAHALHVDLANLHHNTSDGVHIASAGGVWSALVGGFGGVRDHDERITIDPRLPDLWEGLTFRITLQGARVRVEVRHDQVTLTLETGTETRLTVRGRDFVVTAGQPTIVHLEESPRLIGAPTLSDIEGNLRPDGTAMAAVVPGEDGLALPDEDLFIEREQVVAPKFATRSVGSSV